MVNGDWYDWFADKDFSADWTSHNIPVWLAVLARLRMHPLRILEIGCYEGRSAVFWMEFFPHARLTVVDAFTGPQYHAEEQAYLAQLPFIEQRFDKNTAPYGSRVTKLKGSSARELAILKAASHQFDLIYIDGCHQRDMVMLDSLLSWQLLSPGGILIWDDYELGPDRVAEHKPRDAIDTFLHWHSSEVRELHRGWQIIIERLDRDNGAIAQRLSWGTVQS
jgi:predicted O-methyltransferase YrrM